MIIFVSAVTESHTKCDRESDCCQGNHCSNGKNVWPRLYLDAVWQPVEGAGESVWGWRFIGPSRGCSKTALIQGELTSFWQYQLGLYWFINASMIHDAFHTMQYSIYFTRIAIHIWYMQVLSCWMVKLRQKPALETIWSLSISNEDKFVTCWNVARDVTSCSY